MLFFFVVICVLFNVLFFWFNVSFMLCIVLSVLFFVLSMFVSCITHAFFISCSCMGTRHIVIVIFLPPSNFFFFLFIFFFFFFFFEIYNKFWFFIGESQPVRIISPSKENIISWVALTFLWYCIEMTFWC